MAAQVQPPHHPVLEGLWRAHRQSHYCGLPPHGDRNLLFNRGNHVCAVVRGNGHLRASGPRVSGHGTIPALPYRFVIARGSLPPRWARPQPLHPPAPAGVRVLLTEVRGRHVWTCLAGEHCRIIPGHQPWGAVMPAPTAQVRDGLPYRPSSQGARRWREHEDPASCRPFAAGPSGAPRGRPHELPSVSTTGSINGKLAFWPTSSGLAAAPVATVVP